MKVKNKVLLVGLAMSGAAATTLTWLYAEQLDDEHEAIVADQIEVVKAHEKLPAGTPLTKDRLRTEKVPRKFLPPNPLLESELSIYLGTPVAVTVDEGAMILTSDFSVPEYSRWDTSPLVIKSAKLTLETESPREASHEALKLIVERGGYIVQSELFVQKEQNVQRFTMTARVPAVEFESVLLESRQIGEPTEEWVKGAGVTEEVRELEEKLGIKKELAAKLDEAAKRAEARAENNIEIIRGDTVIRTGSDNKEAVEVEEKLADVREKVAEMTTHGRELEHQVAMSTIEISIQQPRPEMPVATTLTVGEQIERAFMVSGRTLLKVSLGLLQALAFLLPIAMFLAPFAVAVAVWHRRRRA